MVVNEPKSMICECGGELRGCGFPNITGTETSFGIRKAFYDPKTKQEINTYKKWHDAGFRDGHTSKNPIINEKLKEYRYRKGKMTIKPKATEMAERI
jgi:trimethylamine:corrinoid methyltransferase-like protein